MSPTSADKLGAYSGEDGSQRAARPAPPPLPPRPAGWKSNKSSPRPQAVSARDFSQASQRHLQSDGDGAGFERQPAPYSSGGFQTREQPLLERQRWPYRLSQGQILERGTASYSSVPRQTSETGSYQPAPSGQSTTHDSHATSQRAFTGQQARGNDDPPNAATAQWDPLYYSNGTPTAVLTELLDDVFRCLDPQQTGYIRPETYSSFLTAIGWPETQDLWKLGMKPGIGPTAEDAGDMFFTNFLRALDIEHTYTKRHAGPLIPGSLGMPWITGRGFRDLFAFEFAAEPLLAPGCLNRLVQVYGLSRGRGPVPRECCLPRKPAEVAERERVVTERARAGNMELLEATRLHGEISKRGRENAKELLSPYWYTTRAYGGNWYSDLI